MRMPRRGEVWWIAVPEAGRRPGLILTRDAAIPLLSRVLVAPASRTIRHISTEVFLDEEDGFPTACVLALDSVALVSKRALASRIVTLSADRMVEVCAAVAVAFGCSQLARSVRRPVP